MEARGGSSRGGPPRDFILITLFFSLMRQLDTHPKTALSVDESFSRAGCCHQSQGRSAPERTSHQPSPTQRLRPSPQGAGTSTCVVGRIKVTHAIVITIYHKRAIEPAQCFFDFFFLGDASWSVLWMSRGKEDDCWRCSC